jgi:tetratricopeptide (TPR) repeat protein
MKSDPKSGPKSPDVLEHNVGSLLGAFDPPRLDDGARARIRAQLVARHAVAPRKKTSPLYAIGFGLAAAAGVAVVAGALIGSDRTSGVTRTSDREVALADGTKVLLDTGATVDVLGPRRVRVTGSALLDVAHGKDQFVVETQHGQLAVLGTRFVVEATSVRTLAAVIRGQVRLATENGKVVLHAGEQGVAEPGRPPSRGPAPRLSHLASWAAAVRKSDDDGTPKAVRNGTLFARDPSFRPHPPYPDNEFPLPLAQLTVDAVVDHQVARVALDQTFENPQAQDLEGVYRFAIPADAALQRFAMYVDGTLTESAVVERMRARRIYEELVYRRVDPGLLEWSGAGRLALRVFPLRALSDKRIVLAYTQSLPRLYDDWTLTVPLPEVDAAVDEVVFNVRVKDCAACELHSPSHAVNVAKDGDDAIVTYKGAGEEIGDSLVLVARDPRTEAQVATHTTSDGQFVAVRARPDLGAGANQPADTYRQRSWVIVDDVSASRGNLERKAQADVVEALLRELDEDDRVAVLTVDSLVRAHAGLERVDDVDHRAVRAFLTSDEVGGVGATDLGKAFDRATEILAGVDARDAFVLYLGDGVVTGGDRALAGLRARLAGKATFVGVGIGDGADTPTLAALADATGGSVYAMDLADDLAWRTFDLVASLYTSRVTGLSASLVNARGETIASQVGYLRAGQLGDGEELELVARVPAGNDVAAVQLVGQRDGQPWRQSVPLAAARRSDGGYLPRLWAQRHVAALLLAKEDAVVVPPCTTQPCASEDELRTKRREELRLQIVDLGKKYFLLSRHTSLLVLENDAMYAQYGVTKGAGDTWSPYAVPPKVEVHRVAAAGTTPNGVDPGTALVRTPVARFYDYGAVYRQGQWDAQLARRGDFRGRASATRGMDLDADRAGWWDEEGESGGVILAQAVSEHASGPVSGPMKLQVTSEPQPVVAGTAPTVPPDETMASATIEKFDDNLTADSSRDGTITAAITTGTLAERQETWMVAKEAKGGGIGHGYGRASRNRWHGGYGGQAPYPIAFHYPTDPHLDDLTELVPAFFPGAVDDAERDLVRAAGGGKGSIDAKARAMVDRARAALPVGTYRLGDGASIAVTGGTLSWRTTDENGLEELARLDGATWRRAYPELGLEVTRDLGARTPALLLAVMPLLVPDADHLATWFAVTVKGDRTLVLAPAGDAAKPMLEIELDGKDRVVAIRTPAGTELLAVTWGAQGPTAASLGGAKSTIGFTPSIDPVTVPSDLVSVALPLALPAAAAKAVAATTVGSPEWRAAQRQVMATAAATADPNAAWTAYDALVGHGGAQLGDAVLAARTLAIRSDADYRRAMAGFSADAVNRPAAVRYLDAARAYAKKYKPDALAPAVDTGLVGAVWRFRHMLALATADKREAAVAALEAMGDRAPDLRLVGAAIVGQRWDWSSALKTRAWAAVAKGDLRNVARYEAVRSMYNSGEYAAAGDAIVTLMGDLDLTAAPVVLDYTALGAVQSSPRGQAGFDMAWRGYLARVLADGNYAHVMALAQSTLTVNRQTDLDRVLGRAAELAGDDRAKKIDVLRFAVSTGQTDRAAAMLPELLAGTPDPVVERVAMQLALDQGKPDEAADHLQRAIDAADGAVTLAQARNDFTQLVALRGRVAQLARGTARDAAVARVMSVAKAWRDIDPANAQVDSQVGELLLELERPEEAWRQLSTAIERDPMSGSGWILVADALERHGQYDQALATWQEAIVIDQTNPGPRLRKAQLYYALGKTAEGDAIVKDAAPRKWHDRFSNDAYQLHHLAQQRKLTGK